MRLTRLLVLTSTILAAATPAFADITAFIGSTTTPSNRTVKGVAFGFGLLIVGFEFEYASTAEDLPDAAPALRTGMGNVLVQTPVAIFGVQPYLTIGAGAYREALGEIQETNVGINTGGGVKLSLIGPLRARVDYRVFSLRGDPLHSTAHRVYAGVNLGF